MKLSQSGLLSRRAMLARLGLSDDEIEAEMAEIDTDAMNARDIKLGRYMANISDR